MQSWNVNNIFAQSCGAIGAGVMGFAIVYDMEGMGCLVGKSFGNEWGSGTTVLLYCIQAIIRKRTLRGDTGKKSC